LHFLPPTPTSQIEEDAEEEKEETQHKGTKAQRSEGKEMRDVLRKKDNNQIPGFSVSYPYSYSYPYSNSSAVKQRTALHPIDAAKRPGFCFHILYVFGK